MRLLFGIKGDPGTPRAILNRFGTETSARDDLQVEGAEVADENGKTKLKLGHVLVTEFDGVDPTGATDSTAGLVAGIATLPAGTTLVMVDGLYRIDSGVTFPSTIRVEFRGGRLTGAGVPTHNGPVITDGTRPIWTTAPVLAKGVLPHLTWQMFGAVGDGGHDDWYAMQSAITASMAGAGKILATRAPVIWRVTQRLVAGHRYVDEDEYQYYGYLIYSDHGPSWNQTEYDLSHSQTPLIIEGDECYIWGDFTGPMSAVDASGTTPPTVTLSGAAPVGRPQIRIGITVGGLSDGTAHFRWSSDNGATYSSSTAIPTGGGAVALTGTGLTATFAAGTYNTDNTWVAHQTVQAILYWGAETANGASQSIRGVRFYGRDAATSSGPIFWGDIVAPGDSGQMGLFIAGNTFTNVRETWFYGLVTPQIQVDNYWGVTEQANTFACVTGPLFHRHNAGLITQCNVSGAEREGYRITAQGCKVSGCHTEQADPDMWIPTGLGMVVENCYWESDATTTHAALVLGDPGGLTSDTNIGNPSQHVTGLTITGGFSHSHNYWLDVTNSLGVTIRGHEHGRDDGQYSYLFRDDLSHVEDIDAIHDIQQFAARHDIVDPAGFDGLKVTRTWEPDEQPPGTVVVKFDRPGAPLSKQLGGRLHFERNSGAYYVVDGQLQVADVNQARIDDDGLLIEPAATNLLSDTLNLAAGSWVTSNFPLTANQPSLHGDTTASVYRGAVDGSALDHLLYQAGTLAASTTTFSFYFGYLPGNLVRYVRMGDNSSAHFAYFDLELGTVKSVTGATTHAEIEKAGVITTTDGTFTVYRCSVTCTPTSGLLVTVYPSANGTSTSFQDDGTGRLYLWHPQTEVNPYATTWIYPTNNPRGAETALIPIPNLGGEWCVEIVATPCGPNQGPNAGGAVMGWSRGSHMPLFSIGVLHGGNSIEGYINAGNAVCSVYDPTATELKCTSTALAVGNYYSGPRRIAFSSLGQARPAVYLDGRQTVPTIAGSGTGIFLGSAPMILRIGSTNDGTFGGFKIREIRIVPKSAVPPTEPIGAYSYQWAMDRCYVPRAKCIAFLGDSNQQGVYDFSIRPYPFATVTADQQAHIYAIGSNTARQALRRWRLDIRGRGYKKMVLQIGINDINALFPAEQVIADITTIVDEAVRDGVHVAIGTVFPAGHGVDYRTDQLDAVNTAIRALGVNSLFVSRVSLIEFYDFLDDGTGKMQAGYDYDGGSLHLSQAGQDAVAPLVTTALAAI